MNPSICFHMPTPQADEHIFFDRMCTSARQVLSVHEAFLERLSRGWLLSRSDSLARAMDTIQACVHTFCDLIAEVETAVTDTTPDTPASGMRSPGGLRGGGSTLLCACA